MPQNIKSKPPQPDAPSLAASRAPMLEPQRGFTIDVNDAGVDAIVLAEAIDHAFHYRGDVTITVRDESIPVVGYVFDRRRGECLEDSVLRMIPADGSARRTISYSEIQRIQFTGRDTAEGRSFDTWMRKYVEKKLAGEEASIHE